MTGPSFSGGWLDLRRLLQVLDGRPLQADLEEVFTPRSGGEPRRRNGRVWVDCRRRVRLDVNEDGQPPVMFCFDPGGEVLLCGVVDQPETWVRSPWRMSLESPIGPPPDAASDLAAAFRVELTDAEGSHLYRMVNARYQEPDSSVFP